MLKKIVLIACCSLTLMSGVSTIASAQDLSVVMRFGPPEPRTEYRPRARNGYTWADGHWESRGRRHTWVKGYWLRNQRGYNYEQARWEHGQMGIGSHADADILGSKDTGCAINAATIMNKHVGSKMGINGECTAANGNAINLIAIMTASRTATTDSRTILDVMNKTLTFNH
nr:YXWGXW repeat-containing protein [uncultured Undibacterium sp.]